MQKSEMINRLMNTLERCHDRYGDLHDYNSVVKDLLEDMLDAGMLAPETNIALSDKVKKELYLTGEHFERKNEWESEDE